MSTSSSTIIDLTPAEAVAWLESAKIYQHLFDGYLSLQLRLLLSFPGITAAMERKLDLPVTDNCSQFLINYPLMFYVRTHDEEATDDIRLDRAAATGMLDIVTSIVKTIPEDQHLKRLQSPLTLASRYGHIDVREYLLDQMQVENNTKLCIAADGSVIGGRLDDAKNLIDRGGDLNSVLYFALGQIGDLERIERVHIFEHQQFLETNPPNIENPFDDPGDEDKSTIRWSNYPLGVLLGGAAAGGHLDLVHWIVKQGFISQHWSSRAFISAVTRNHTSVAMFLVHQFYPFAEDRKYRQDDRWPHPDIMIEVAVRNSNEELTQFFQEHRESVEPEPIWRGAAAGGRLELFRQTYNQVEVPEIHELLDLRTNSLGRAMSSAARHGQMAICEYILSLASSPIEKKFLAEVGMHMTALWTPLNKHHRRRLIAFFIDQGATNWNTTLHRLQGNCMDPELFLALQEKRCPVFTC